MRNSKLHVSTRRTRSSLSIILLVSLCCFFYALGAWQKSGTGRGDSIALKITKETDCSILPNLYFETHHNKGYNSNSNSNSLTQVKAFEPCEFKYTDYTPCFDTRFRERKCPDKREKLKCLVPAPNGYVIPFTWPKSRDFVPFKNVPCTKNNLMHFEGGLCKFHDAGIEKYIAELATVVPISDGMVRTALDIGSGVGSFGAYLLDKNILTVSFAPKDSVENPIQFALERGVPAVIGEFGSVRLPYPSGAFDLVHCSRCLVNWTSNEGMYMMEADRILRPGGYWILSRSPFQKSNRPKEELEKIESISETLCWKKKTKHEKGETVIWQKSLDRSECGRKLVSVCQSDDSDDVWYKKMEPCITKSDSDSKISSNLKPFPERLFSIPPRLSNNPDSFNSDNKLWRKHVNAYKRINKLIGSSRYRNIMDMNANLGSFGANIIGLEKGINGINWVMNVVPSISERNDLGVIYERGLIGIYHDWCEAFSTYPRTYDLIHASGLFTLYQHKCDIEDILLEMDRILRPEGAVIIRDNVDLLNKIKIITSGMRWKSKIFDHEDGPLVPEKILICVKEYWVGTGGDNIL
ncbi:hypothetical protein LUZ60_014327 [Juncus effusus]|nr:hypothetical protein LUZ60_014327 [Juncus effusus]